MLLLVTGVKDANQRSAIKVGQLLISARDVVGGLTAAEEEFVDGLEEGRCAEWKTKQTLRGALIRWICTDAHARDAVKVTAVYLQNVEIQGMLDLTFAVVPWPLLMTNCAVCDEMRLLYATTKLLNFDNSTIGQFDAGGVRIDGNLWLRNARISRGLKLSLAEIAGNLECDGAELSAGEDGVAFRAEQMHVAGSMMLRCIYKAGRQKRFVGTGMTRLSGARIDGQLSCDGAVFHNPHQGPAIVAEHLKVGMSVFAINGFYAGEVSFNNATVEGALACDGSSFVTGATGEAFVADGIDVGTEVRLGNGFQAFGVVRLPSAKIGGSLDCDGGRFLNPAVNSAPLVPAASAPALIAQGITVGRAVRLRGAECLGMVDLTSARVSGDLDCQGVVFCGASGLLAERASIGGRFWWTNVKGCSDATLSLLNARAGVLVDDQQSWPRSGRLLVDGFTYEAIGEMSTVPVQARLDWLSRMLQFRAQPYQHLAQLLRSMGHETDAREVLIDKERRIRATSLSVLQRVWSWFLRSTIGYGYKPFRILRWASTVVLIGWLFVSLGARGGLMRPLIQDAQYERLSPLAYSVDAFLPMHALHQEDHWWSVPTAICKSPCLGFKWPCGLLLRLWLWTEILVGWGLTALLVAGLTGLVKRE